MITPFESKSAPRILFGAGASARAGEIAASLGARKILLVTDPGLVRAGHAARIEQVLSGHCDFVKIFDRVVENPTTREALLCAEAAAGCDAIVALGGGSTMDTAKGGNFLATNGGRMQDYAGYGKASRPMLPLIAIPTTAGTGSECQSYALISDEVTHVKMACGDPRALPAAAILDPELTATQPPFVAACTGIDALAHAIESATCLRATPFSHMFSRQAFELLDGHLERAWSAPHDEHARAQVLLGAAFSGMAIENSMLGAAHSAANPLTARFGVTHGLAIGFLLPHVIRFNGEDATVAHRFAVLGSNSATDPASLADRVATLFRCAGLSAPEIDPVDLARAVPELALAASQQWTAQFNPRPIAASDFERFYRLAFGL